MPLLEVVEYTDPGCSWAWGTEPKLRLLRWMYGDRLSWRRVMGGLVPDVTLKTPSFDPLRGVARQIEYWRNVTRQTGMPYPARLQYTMRSTEPACIAVKAAELQGEDVAARVLRRLREATYVYGTPPDTAERAESCVRSVASLDVDRLEKDMASEAVADAFRADWEETRNPNEFVMNLDESPAVGGGRAKNADGRWRYVFPTVIIGDVTVAGWKPWERYVEALGGLEPVRSRPTSEEALAEWGTLAPKELEFICGTSTPPAGATAYDWGAGVFYLSEPDA